MGAKANERAKLERLCRYENTVTSILAVAAVLNVLLNLVLIPNYGAWGAVVASAITILLWKLVFWLRLYQEFQILPGGLGLLKHQ